MKKILCGLFSIMLMIIFAGCTNSTKTLARNLDSTITNLIYSVSNLDLLDKTTISQVKELTNSLNGITTNNNNLSDIDNNECTSKNTSKISALQTNAEIQNIIKIKTEPKIENKDCDGSNKDCTTALPDKENNANQQNISNTNNENKNAILNSECENNSNNIENITENAENCDKCENDNDCDKQDDNISNDSLTPNNNSSNNEQNNIINNENIKDNQIEDFSNIANGITEDSTVDTTTPLTSLYTNLELSSNRIQALINDLVNIRTVIMLYISDLYNGNISISQQEINAINSYANIIKESTAYLRSNRGMVRNHINEANNFLTDGNNSSLANSHIIRATETLNTRCAKLEAAIIATYNIANIIKNNIDATSNNENINASGNNLEETDNIASALSGFEGSGLFGQNSPNYYINNPMNMGVNGGNYFYNGNLNYNNMGYGYYPYSYNNYGYYPNMNMNEFPINNANYNVGYNGYNYMLPNYNFGYGNYNSPQYGNYGYGNSFNNFGYENSVNPIIEKNNNVIPNSGNLNINSTKMPNVLTGLVSKDEQESLIDAENQLEDNLLDENKLAICSANFIEDNNEINNENNNLQTLEKIHDEIDPEFSVSPEKHITPHYHNAYQETTRRIFEKYQNKRKDLTPSLYNTKSVNDDCGYIVNLNEKAHKTPYKNNSNDIMTLEYLK